VATNQRDGQMTYHVDGVEAGENPHVNYEPSSQNALHEAPRRGKDHTPQVRGLVVRQKISRTNGYAQAGERYRTMHPIEREELVKNLSMALAQCTPEIRDRMIQQLERCDAEYGRERSPKAHARRSRR